MRTTCWACDFCGKTEHEVDKIILGPRELAICSECVILCMDIVNGTAEPLKDEPAAPTGPAQPNGENK
jgi:ATP-dependent Clp protease ATP-binding subunit ClpX